MGIPIKILIVGHGFVGKAVDYGFSHPNVEKTIIDPIYGSDVSDIIPHLFDAAFVCVPTPMHSDGQIDSRIIEDVVRRLHSCPMIVIKSTATPDVVGQWSDRDRIVYNPEFLTEKSANEQFVEPEFHIFGGKYEYTKQLQTLYEKYSLCNHCPTYHMSIKEASFVKYTINSFLAMKVTFFNQLYDAVGDTDANFHTIIKAVAADKRIGPSHTKVPGFDGKQGYGGACFPKDTSALTNYSKRFTLIEECVRINNEYRNQYELDEREKQQNVNYGQTQKELEDQNDGSPSSI